MNLHHRLLREVLRRAQQSAAVFGVFLFILLGTAVAQPADAGSLSGRVQNRVTGDYLVNARVSLRGTNRSVLTDEGGFYSFSNVPAGSVTIDVHHAGLATEPATVEIPAGERVTQDFQMVSVGRRDADDLVELDAFTVQSTRETDAAAIAVNEQRVSFTQKSVINADQFGTIPDTNPGELMKWLPGVSVEYFANNIVGVSVRGLDAANTAITFDGMPMASGSTTTGDRNFEVLGASAADIARVEVRKLRTPEDSANAVGGSINLIRRSAFEASKPRFVYNLFLQSDAEEFGFEERDGIRDTKMQGWRPNWRFMWTHPVSKNFGYAVTLARSDSLTRVHWALPSWNFGTPAQAAAAEAQLAAGETLTTPSVYNPARTQDLLHDNPKQDITDSASVKFDWRPFPELKLSYSLTGSRYQERTGDELRFTWGAGTPRANGPDYTLGAVGATSGGNIQYDMREAWRNGIKPAIGHVIDSEWKKGDWTLRARGAYSTSKHTYRDTEDGFFNSTTFVGSSIPNTGIGANRANPRRITVNLLDRGNYLSNRIESFDAITGEPVDWQDLDNMYIGGAVSRPAKFYETVAGLRLSARKDFDFRNPLAIQAGFDYDETYRNRQIYDAKLWRFVGADGIAGTPDDSAKQIEAINVQPERDSSYDTPAVPRISLARLYSLYQDNPGWFQYLDAESHRFSVRDPYELNEKTYAGYVQITGSLFKNRLNYIGGVRYERSEAWGLGLLDHGGPQATLAQAQARYVRKGARGEGSNDGYFPSAEISYNLTDNLIARFGYAETQAKNRFQRSVIPTNTIDPNPPTSGQFVGEAIGTVNLRNPNLQPWTAENFEAHLEYYTPQGGVLSAGVYRKNVSNNQVSKSVLLDTPEALAALGLDSEFLNYRATTWLNEGVLRIDGAELEIRQPLDVLVPDFARGFTFIGSFNYNNLSKYPGTNPSIDFQNFYETQYKGNLAYRRGRLNANIGFVRNGRVYRQRDDLTASGVSWREGHRFYPAYTTVDFNLEYSITKWARIFFSGRNITDARKTRVRVIEDAPEWSQLHIENNLGVSYTVGITGTF